ncbi:MAG: YraN family protein [Peptococcaceae bacterium]|nr:YraN family protein [Peptococcaceae bacterium]
MNYKDLNKRLSKRELGNLGENLAVEHLQREGLKILARNYRCPKGEMDIIARDGDCLVFVEVRTRSSSSSGRAEESIVFHKLQRLKAIAMLYLLEQNIKKWPSLRFDVVAINITAEEPQINWLKNII